MQRDRTHMLPAQRYISMQKSGGKSISSIRLTNIDGQATTNRCIRICTCNHAQKRGGKSTSSHIRLMTIQMYMQRWEQFNWN